MKKLKLDTYQNSLTFVWEFHVDNERHRGNGMPTVIIFYNLNDKEPLAFYHDNGIPIPKPNNFKDKL